MTDRKRYMSGEISHEEYYRLVAKYAGVSYAKADPAFLAHCKRALDNGDEHLNSIPLSTWDILGASILNPGPAFKKAGDFPSMAGLVCLVKQAVRDAIT